MATQFLPGRRVSAVMWGEKRTGTVERHAARSVVVWVRWDGSRRLDWMHAESLSPIAED